MADPHHVPVLDSFDQFTVRLYRTGLSLAAGGLAWATVALIAGRSPVWAWMCVVLGTALAVLNVHLYDKRVRWVIQTAAWTGALLQLVAAGPVPEVVAHWAFHAGLGFFFVSLSGFALKEQFCFRLPALRLVPLLLATSLLPLVAGVPQAAGVLVGLAALIYVALAVAKVRMPLHFDVGDKSKYQI